MNELELVARVESTGTTVAEASLLSLGECLKDLYKLAKACENNRDYDSAVAACRGTRFLWCALHQHALFNPIKLTDELLTEAQDGIRMCTEALDGVQVDSRNRTKPRRLGKLREAMARRIDLVRRLREDGIAAVDEQLRLLIQR